jgi:hypothetical protein
MKYIICSIAALVAFGAGRFVSADTVAYWRFETGPAGDPVSHTIGDGQFEAAVTDVSGNGNHLSTWTQGGCCGYQYRTEVPYSPVPQSGDANNFSVKNTGGGPGMFTDSAVSMPSGVDIETMMPLAFTVEASFKPENGGYRTYVGRDSRGVATSNGDLAALYLQVQPDNSMAFKFTDAAGNFHEAISAPGLIHGFDFGSDPDGQTGTWYNVAGTSDGSTLKLYVNGSLEASTDIVSADAHLTFGGDGGGDWHPGEWSVGRGMYGGGHGDRGYGYIDEVRISDSALSPTEFLVRNALSLEVNTNTGEVTLANDAAVAVSVDFYRISSAGAALSLGGWNSLDDQNYDAVDGTDGGTVAGDSVGEGWDQSGGSNNSQLIEYFLAEAGSSIGAGETLSLGNAFNTSIFGSGFGGDLEFTYGLIGGSRLTGNVTYVTGGVDGDYNHNGVVDAADYTVWRNMLGQSGAGLAADGNGDNMVTQADYAYWKERFGNSSGSGSAAASAVPEPSSLMLLTAIVGAMVLGRRTKC